MAEILEKQVCESCGVDIRPKALFCYNCGSQVASDEAVQAEIEHEKKISNAWFKEELTETPAVTIASTVKPKVAVEEKVKPEENGKKTELPTDNSIKLKSAASLRDRSKLGGKKTVEIEWDEPKSAPNIWFLIVALILAAFAGFILFAMLYIR